MPASDFMEIAVEKKMLRDLAEGNEAAFGHIYSCYSPAVYANIRKMVIPAGFAEDILQEVFMALWANRHKINTEQSIAGWLFVVSHNKAITYLKKKLRETIVPLPLSDVDIPEDMPTDEQYFASQTSMLEEAISHLSPQKRTVFQLCHFEGKTYEEVATALGISVPSVKDYLKQSSAFIKKYVHNHFMNIAGMSLLLFVLELQ